jgi:uncharacterized membrane protein YphA (DoxX/SURF4 family)
MNAALWTIAALLAAAFLVAGLNKLLIPREKLARAPGGGWALDFTPRFVKILGALEILGSAGLILPGVLHIAPVLVPVAATCLAALMTGATVVVLRRREYVHVLVDLTYLALALFLAVSRFGAGPTLG